MSDRVARRQHWDEIYHRRSSEELGWYEPEPSTLELVLSHSTPDESVIDVGGGDSRLVDCLLDRGYRDVTVLDVSPAALERVRARLGPGALGVTTVEDDITSFQPHRSWDLWHDRAVFHFLVTVDEQRRYGAVAGSAVRPGGILIVAAFSPDGPGMCAGLPVVRHDEASLAGAFESDFEPITVEPLRPSDDPGADQRPYLAAVLRRRRSAH